jgi:hypothetical protein
VGLVLLRAYQVECDHPSDCARSDQLMVGGGGYWSAVTALRARGWGVRVLNRGRVYFCPDHREDL